MKYDRAMSSKQNNVLRSRKAVIYCRVSTKRQGTEGSGLDSQEAVSREYAARQGYEVVEVFRDKMTGKVRDRPGLRALMAFLRKHRREGIRVVIDDLDRFSRHLKNHLELRDLLKEAGGTLESPRMKFGDSPAERLLENVMMSAAQFHTEHNREQVLGRQKGRLLDGFWPFSPPRGMRQQHFPGMGKVLVRQEPEASVIAEGLQLFADGHIRSQAEFARWLFAHPHFDKRGRDEVTNQQAHDILTNVIYAGMVERPEWDVKIRRGQHDGLISYESFEKIQRRLTGASYAPARRDLSSDFPLRGSVTCGHCGGPLTACWSRSKTGDTHPYYMCYARDCSRNRKSIRRDAIEGAFVELLEGLIPKPTLFSMTKILFRHAWQQRTAQASAIAKACDKQLSEIDAEIARTLDRIVDLSSSAVIAAFERKVEELERSKLVLQERRDKSRETNGSFDQLFELALTFLQTQRKSGT